MTQIELISFIPQTASYQIWHPKEFLVNESEDNIVTITSPETDSNLTLTGYSTEQNVTEKMLSDFFIDRTKSYMPTSDQKNIIIQDRIWLEREFRKDNIHWLWWALSHSNKIILASVNSENILSLEDRHLYTFMIDKMQIYPSNNGE